MRMRKPEAGEIAGLNRPLRVRVDPDARHAIRKSKPDVVVLCTALSVQGVMPHSPVAQDAGRLLPAVPKGGKVSRGELVVRIDMEDYAHCQMTLDILRELRETFDNVGTVIQAYLFRAEQDVKELKGIPLRLVKGAHQESPTAAFQDKAQIDENYMRIIEEHLLSGTYTAIASHDHHIIAKVKEFAHKNNIPRTQFEFQMLYGFRTDMQLSLAKEGYTMRVYVPFGNDWFGYFMRRLAERPQNVAFALKGFFSK